METRAAARKAAEALQASTDEETAVELMHLKEGNEPAPFKKNHGKTTWESQDSALKVPVRVGGGKNAKMPQVPRPKARAPAKGRHGKAAPPPSMNREWALPHGMGTSIDPAPQDTAVTVKQEGIPEEDTGTTSVSIVADVPGEALTAVINTVAESGATDISAVVPKGEIDMAGRSEITSKETITINVGGVPTVFGLSAKSSSRKLLTIKGVTISAGTAWKTEGENVTANSIRVFNQDFKMTLKGVLANRYGLCPGFSPYPHRTVPTAEQCEEVFRILVEMHTEPVRPATMPLASLLIAGCGEVPNVLDALLRTLISGNTLMKHSDAAIRNLVSHYGVRDIGTGKGSIDWDKVRQSPQDELKGVIQVSGSGNKKAGFIKGILDTVYEKNKKEYQEKHGSDTDPAKFDLLSLDDMHKCTKDEALRKFVEFPGIGVKTAACVTLFCLQKPSFAVDTHVHRFCRWLGWVPSKAGPDSCFHHTDHMVPDHLKYGLHQLFIRHGQECFKCRANTRPGSKDWNDAPDCPLEHLLARIKDESVFGKRKREDYDAEAEADDDDGVKVEEGDMIKTEKKKTRKPKTNVPPTEPSYGLDAGDESDSEHEDQLERKKKKPLTIKAKARKSSDSGEAKTKPKPRTARKGRATRIPLQDEASYAMDDAEGDAVREAMEIVAEGTTSTAVEEVASVMSEQDVSMSSVPG